MSLSRKIVLMLSAIFFVLTIVLGMILSYTLLNNFSATEQDIMKGHIVRTRDALQRELHHLDTGTADYSRWTATYDFIESGDPTYLTENLSESTFTSQRLNLVIFARTNGEIVYSAGFDLQKGTMTDVLPGVLALIKPGSPLLTFSNTESYVNGLLDTPEGALLISSHPALTNEGDGPIHGAVIFGRYLNATEIQLISETIAQPLDVRRINDGSMPADFQHAYDQIAAGTDFYSAILDGSTLAGYCTLKDINLQPVAVAQVTMERMVYQQGIHSLLVFWVALFIMNGAIIAFAVVTLRRYIIDPVRNLTQVAICLAKGDTSVHPKYTQQHDEIGELAVSLADLANYLEDSSQVAHSLAQGNLVQHVALRSDQDALGQALERMINSLRDSINQVSQSARNVNAASNALANTSEQAGRATAQISSTIQEVAKGLQLQSTSVNDTASSMEQMVRAIDGVAKGAQEQAAAVARSATITAQLSDSISQVSGNVQAVSNNSAIAAEAARKGAITVEQTIEGMQMIRNKMNVSSEKVQEMGQHSDKIGTITETINDIASQTNLLALNAAIEAARVGAQSQTLMDIFLNRMMVVQARLIAEFLVEKPHLTMDGIRKLAKQTGVDVIGVTDADGVRVLTNEAVAGFRFSDDPREQTYEFRQLIQQKDGVVCQKAQQRSIDGKIFKYVGVSRLDQPGIVQVGMEMKTLTEFSLQTAGFAVVASEVRKLADRSSAATKEIGSLIRQIQQTAKEAVLAMKEGNKEVVSGVAQANEAGRVLDAILEAAEAVNQQAQQAAGVSQQMMADSNELVSAVDTVSAVVEQNTAATEDMSASSSGVKQSIENIAAVSEENSASIEEVSASTEQLNAQIEAVAASAQSLAEMAQLLQQVVAQFKL